MLGIGGAAAVAHNQQLVAGAQRGDDRSGGVARNVEQSCVARSALKGAERSFQMDGDRIPAHKAPSVLKDATVVLTAPPQSKVDAMATLTFNAGSRVPQYLLGDGNHC
jgi:hypothetical protein